MPLKVLVVDDELDLEILVRQHFRRKIRAGEYDFEFAHNGIEALAKLKEVTDIDVVMSDINMPEMDGLALIKNISEYHPLLRAVVVSAYGDMDNVRTAMNNGAFDFVTKPINFDDLEITLQKTYKEVVTLKDASHTHDKLISVQNELSIAQKIQLSFLPKNLPVIPGWDIKAMFRPAKEVGGDFYDSFILNNNRYVCNILADVCGKGVGAALFMAVIRSLLRAFAIYETSAEESILKMVKTIQSHIHKNHDDSGIFVTLFVSLFDTETGEILYCNSGHNPPLIRRGDGKLDFLMPSGPAVGIFEDTDYKVDRTILNSGDIFITYTDGVTEANNRSGKLFGDPRLAEIVSASVDGSESLINAILKEIEIFADGADQSDDITMLAVKRNN